MNLSSLQCSYISKWFIVDLCTILHMFRKPNLHLHCFKLIYLNFLCTIIGSEIAPYFIMAHGKFKFCKVFAKFSRAFLGKVNVLLIKPHTFSRGKSFKELCWLIKYNNNVWILQAQGQARICLCKSQRGHIIYLAIFKLCTGK